MSGSAWKGKIWDRIRINFSWIPSLSLWMPKSGSSMGLRNSLIGIILICFKCCKSISIDTLNHLNSLKIEVLFIFDLVYNLVYCLLSLSDFVFIFWRRSHSWIRTFFCRSIRIYWFFCSIWRTFVNLINVKVRLVDDNPYLMLLCIWHFYCNYYNTFRKQ